MTDFSMTPHTIPDKVLWERTKKGWRASITVTATMGIQVENLKGKRGLDMEIVEATEEFLRVIGEIADAQTKLAMQLAMNEANEQLRKKAKEREYGTSTTGTDEGMDSETNGASEVEAGGTPPDPPRG